MSGAVNDLVGGVDIHPSGVSGHVSTVPTPATFLRGALNLLGGRQVKAVPLHTNTADLQVLDRLFEAGHLKVAIDSRHPLEALARAWERSISGRAAGKIIVDVA